MGRARALEVLLSADDYDAELAERYGWINPRCPPGRSMISPAPIPAHRSEASRLQGMGANLALPAHWNLPTQN